MSNEIIRVWEQRNGFVVLDPAGKEWASSGQLWVFQSADAAAKFIRRQLIQNEAKRGKKELIVETSTK